VAVAMSGSESAAEPQAAGPLLAGPTAVAALQLAAAACFGLARSG